MKEGQSRISAAWGNRGATQSLVPSIRQGKRPIVANEKQTNPITNIDEGRVYSEWRHLRVLFHHFGNLAESETTCSVLTKKYVCQNLRLAWPSVPTTSHFVPRCLKCTIVPLWKLSENMCKRWWIEISHFASFAYLVNSRSILSIYGESCARQTW